MPCLIVTESATDRVGKHFKLTRRPLAGGRDPAREIQIVDPGVSRRHFLVRYEDGGHVIVETRAKNGVYVNGTKVSEHRLADGDRIQVGGTVLTYYLDDHDERTDAVSRPRRADRPLREDVTQVPERR